MPVDPEEIAKQARDHAWDWFALHASQRMQTFNHFLVATAFLIAAYAALLEKHRLPAAVVALVGAFVAWSFNRLDYRCRQLVKAGEIVLAVCQARLSERADIADLKIIEVVEQPGSSARSYGHMINVIQWITGAVFLLGAVYAGALAAAAMFE
jgi:hypothetical protein